jgi:hypothetical protein
MFRGGKAPEEREKMENKKINKINHRRRTAMATHQLPLQMQARTPSPSIRVLVQVEMG